MGGTNSETMNGLRFHISGGNAHIHDDSKGLKFEDSAVSFRQNVEAAIKKLEKRDGGIIKIEGYRDSFCLVKDGQTFYAFLTDSRSIKTKLKTFIKACVLRWLRCSINRMVTGQPERRPCLRMKVRRL